jgi:hypothetical protein
MKEETQMRWKVVVTLVSLGLMVHCSKPERSATSTSANTPPIVQSIGTAGTSTPTAAVALPPAPPGFFTLTVHLEVTGIAHLIDDGAEKLVIFPNGNLYKPQHDLILLADAAFSPAGLSKKPETQYRLDGSQVDYYWKNLTPGIEIALKQSGFSSAIDPTLDAPTTGDSPHMECPPNLADTSLHWLPKLSVVSHGSGLVIDTDQTTNPTLDPKVTAARMRVAGGTLEAKLATGERFLFDTKSANDLKQVVAESLMYTFHTFIKDVPSPTYSFYGAPYKGVPTVLTTLNVSKATPEVTLVLANVPHNEFFKPTKEKYLKHFHHYYKIYKSGTGTYKTALPTRDANCGLPAGGGVECGPDRP